MPRISGHWFTVVTPAAWVRLEFGERFAGELARVVEVRHQVDALAVSRMVAQDSLQLGVATQPPRVERRHLRADANDPHVRDRRERIEDLGYAPCAHQQRIAAGQQDVADLAVLADVVDASGDVVVRVVVLST